jgi:hypothetical protein
MCRINNIYTESKEEAQEEEKTRGGKIESSTPKKGREGREEEIPVKTKE